MNASKETNWGGKLNHVCLIRGGKIKFVAKKDSWKEVSNLVYFLDLLIIKRL